MPFFTCKDAQGNVVPGKEKVHFSEQPPNPTGKGWTWVEWVQPEPEPPPPPRVPESVNKSQWRWLERLAPGLYHEGRFCPRIAYKRRRVRGPTDWFLLILLLTIIALGVYGGTLYYAGE